MFSHNQKISTRQATILLILQMFNMGILIIPKLAAGFVGRNGYVLPIGAVVFGAIYTFCIGSLTMRFPNDTLVEFLPKILPKFIAYIIVIVFGIKIVVSTGLELRMFGEMISQVMLPKTPIAVIILVMLLTVAYLVKSGIEATARMGEILLYFIFIPLIIVFIVIVFHADYKQLMPFFQAQPEEFAWGAYYTSLFFTPIEIMLMMTALMKKPTKAKRIMFTAIIIIAVLEAGIILLTYAGIGVKESERQIWPVLALMQSIQSKGAVMENQEIFTMTAWVFSVFMYISIGVYFTSLIGSRLCKFKRENVFILPLVPIVYFIAIGPNSLLEAYEYYLQFQRYFGIVFLVPVPIILWLIAKGRKINENKATP